VDPVREGVMYCFANNLPSPDHRERVEQAVRLGIGVWEGSVEYFSIVAAQQNDNWQVEIKLKATETPVYVYIYGPDRNSARISEVVAAAVTAVLP
jgi:hypothetical protein